jgi:hypothetical protein
MSRDTTPRQRYIVGPVIDRAIRVSGLGDDALADRLGGVVDDLAMEASVRMGLCRN